MAKISSGPDSAYQPGDIVYTAFGAGVIVGISNNDRFLVRLWRQIGKSISSASLASLNPSSIMKKLPAAPGMVTGLRSMPEEARSEVLVVAYYPSSDSFLVSGSPKAYPTDTKIASEADAKTLNARRKNIAKSLAEEILLGHVPLIIVPSDQLAEAPSAKFYPLLETLMHRGDETIHAATDILKDERTKAVIDKTSTAFQQKVQDITGALSENDAKSKLTYIVTSMNDVSGSVKVDDAIHQVLKLVKDSDFTDLLRTCHDRLTKLTQERNLSSLTVKTLSQSGIYFNADVEPSSFASAVDTSRKAALESLQQLLNEVEVDSSDIRKQISSQFAHAFDSLSLAARSDESLNALFLNVNHKTREWQDATGRLMETRSAGLFLEGASRLQQRATAILGQGQLDWAGEIGQAFTKSFTEGDAALARLKSIELADAVKDSLVQAIEVRSESIGGLDGIIAGALSQLKDGSSSTNSSLHDLMNNLQKGASDRAADARETLLSVLSSQSIYRDVALLQIESVLCSLSEHFGETLTPDEIAHIARGEGGTAMLFQPIAKRAMLQIDGQLNQVESNITDPTALAVLHKVRNIMSGDMDFSAVVDDLIDVLDDDRFVKASENFIQQSEQVLDIIEGVSANQTVTGALKLVERAGIEKSSVMAELQKLDMNELVSTAGNAISDERARQKLLSTATDAALDFVLRVLPSMKIPSFEGVKDGLIYHISNLSMEGFKVRKEDIHIELAGMRATQRPDTCDSSACGSAFAESRTKRSGIKPTELLIVDVQSISAVLDGAEWSFEQTYMPYLKAQGLANIRFHDGAIRLQFELRRQRKELDPFQWEPVLCLHDRYCAISEVELTLQGESRLAWIVNKAASVFKGPLRDYIVRTVSAVLVRHSGWILERMNKILSPHWGLIMQTAGLQMKNLVETDERVVYKETSRQEQQFVELVWREELPLGINLLLNDESGFLKVVDFPRGSQARAVCEKKNIDPDLFKGSRIVAVNGSHYGGDLDDLFGALKEPGRPKTIRFEVVDSVEAERVQAFVSGNEKKLAEANLCEEKREFKLRELTVNDEGDIGIAFCKSLDNSLAVQGFVEGEGGIVLPAERSQLVRAGDILVKVNDSFVADYGEALALLESSIQHRPISLFFTDPYLRTKEITRPLDGTGGGDELILVREGHKIIINGFTNVNGKAERSGIMIGDYLVFINGQPVGAGCRWLEIQAAPSLLEVQRMIENNDFYPLGLTFARPMRGRENQGAFRDDEAETICVTIDRPDELGCVIQLTRARDVIVADFHSVPGNIQSALRGCPLGCSIQAINGQAVPSYASEDMIKSAINRAWRTDGKVELWLCDDQLKNWLVEHRLSN